MIAPCLTPGSVNSLSIKAPYHADPLALFKSLCKNKKHTLLLESAEIDKKHQLKSLLLLRAAVKIECTGKQVTISALTVNGLPVIEYLATNFSALASINDEGNKLIIDFPSINNQLDEKSRLLAQTPFSVLRQLQQMANNDNHDFGIFIGGCFAFDMISTCEPLPSVAEGENTCPDYVFYLAETLIVIDHEKRSCDIIANVFSGKEQEKYYHQQAYEIRELQTKLSAECTPIQAVLSTKSNLSADVDISDETFCETVNQLKEHIKAGDIFQVVPSRTFNLPCDDSILAYHILKQTNPSPYMFYMQDDSFILFGASPESALKFQRDTRQVELYPIAGTRPRGFKENGEYSPDLDSRIELALRNDNKEKAEHLMLVDLARNDIARVSEPGTRFVADLLKVDRYSHVMHLVSRVCGTLSHDLDALHAYQACMNMGTLSGAPKISATELIRRFEGKRRGSYGGAVGYLTGKGEMDTCIVIRSAFVQNNIAYVQAGAGVVYDSDPQSEANETRQKAQAVLNAVSLAQANLTEA